MKTKSTLPTVDCNINIDNEKCCKQIETRMFGYEGISVHCIQN